MCVVADEAREFFSVEVLVCGPRVCAQKTFSLFSVHDIHSACVCLCRWHPDKWYGEGGVFEGSNPVDINEEEIADVSVPPSSVYHIFLSSLLTCPATCSDLLPLLWFVGHRTDKSRPQQVLGPPVSFAAHHDLCLPYFLELSFRKHSATAYDMSSIQCAPR